MDVNYDIGDNIKVNKSSLRNDLIKSGEWKERMLTNDGWYVLERTVARQSRNEKREKPESGTN